MSASCARGFSCPQSLHARSPCVRREDCWHDSHLRQCPSTRGRGHSCEPCSKFQNCAVNVLRHTPHRYVSPAVRMFLVWAFCSCRRRACPCWASAKVFSRRNTCMRRSGPGGAPCRNDMCENACSKSKLDASFTRERPTYACIIASTLTVALNFKLFRSIAFTRCSDSP